MVTEGAALSITADLRSVPDMARVWSGRTPNKAALLDGGRVVTYAKLNDRSNRIANTLIAGGIRPESHVGFLGAVRAEIRSDGGRVSIHTADGQYRAPLETISTKGFEAVVRNNLTGGFIVMREVYARWMREHGGAIANMIADIWHGWPHFAHSAAARGGRLTPSESAATEWAAAGVRVNTIAPGSIASSGLDTYDSKDNDFIRNQVAHTIPLQRFGTEAEVAAAVVFLLSPAASFITATCVRVDGGPPNAKPGWWDLQPVQHNTPFENAIDIEAHELVCDIWRDFRDDPALRVAVITGTGDAFTAGADLKTHAPEWQTVGPMVGRERLEDGLCGITRGPLSRITKPIVAAINGWCVGHGVELAMACDIRIASERAQFGTFEVRRGMHPADGGIPRLVNTCGVGVALKLLLTGEPISAERALTANMVARVVPHEKLMEETDAVVQQILRCDQAAIESAKETLLEIIGRPLYDQLRVEAMWGYALCGGNTTVMERSQQFFDKVDRGRAGATASPL